MLVLVNESIANRLRNEAGGRSNSMGLSTEYGAEGQKARRKPILRNFKQLAEAERDEVYQSRGNICSVETCDPIENLIPLCEKEDGLPEW